MNLIMYAEVFKDDTWHFVDEPIFKSALPEMQGHLTNRVCDEHNYVLFEVLTGMHFDFNDIYTTIPTIRASKWLPVDVSEEIKNKFSGMYTHILSLSDILNFKWDATISKRGCISEWQYKRMKKKNIPPIATNRVIFDKNAKVVNPFQMDMILASDTLRTSKKYYVNIELSPTPLREYCKFFCNVSMPELLRLIPEGGSVDDVRVIYTVK